MHDKRAADRWTPPEGSRTVVLGNCTRVNAKILDVSNNGMRAEFNQPVAMGIEVYAKITLVENEPSYYVIGNVQRVEKTGNCLWEASVHFSKIKQEPIRKDISL